MHTSLQEVLAVRDAAASAPRHDLYAGIHKGIRLLLGDMLARSGRVDPGDDAAVQALAARVERLADFCAAHLEHENTFIHPELERLRPGSSQRIAAEHVEHERDVECLRAHGRALLTVPPAQRRRACHALYHALALFAAHNLVHMHIEETEHNAVLWAHLSDDEIAAIEGRIIAHLTPETMMESMRWMVLGLSAPERLGLLQGMRAAAPPRAFEAVMALAREVLDEADHAALERGLRAAA